MRILHIVTLVDDRSSYGGPLTVAVNQCIELRRRGHDARIVAGWRGQGAPPTDLEGVPAHLFPVRNAIPRTRFSGLVSPAMVGWLMRNARDFDVAHLHLARDLVPLLAAVLLRRSRVPYTTQTHGMIAPDSRLQAKVLDRLLTLKVLRKATTRFVLTTHEMRSLRSLLDDRSMTVQLPNGIAVVEPAPFTAGRPDVLFLARLHPRKRVMDFAKAAHMLVNKNFDARFSVIGPNDGDLEQLNAYLHAHPELQNSLMYEGALPHNAAVERLAQASIFVLPSTEEPFPMTLLEALAAGIPSICTVSCGVAEKLATEDAAVVIEPGSVNLSNAIGTLLNDPHRRAQLSNNALTAARKHFSMQAVGTQLLESYGMKDERLPSGR